MSLERIEITPVAVIVGELVERRRSGYLTIVRPPLRKVLYWSQGELILVTSADPSDSLADLLVRRGSITPEQAVALAGDPQTTVVSRFHEAGVGHLSWRQTLLREWLASHFIPLFSLDEGTAAFSDDTALEPENRIFVPSTAALVVEGIRSITNGLVLRRSLGDMKRQITHARDSRFPIDALPLTEQERGIALKLREPRTIDEYIKSFGADSGTAAKVAVALLALGTFEVVTVRETAPAVSFDDMQRDMEILAALGSGDQRSLRAYALSRQMQNMDHYQLLEVPRAATRTQVIMQGEQLKKIFDPATYPAIVRDALQALDRRIDEAVLVLRDPIRRAAYDKLLQGGSGGDATIQQRVNQRVVAEENFRHATELSIKGDYYGAIVLLKQTVKFTPDNAQAWYLLGCCQERNPQWKRDAAESFQRALAADPNLTDAMISLGDLYRSQGLISRAQSCYEDALKVSADNQQAKSRLDALKKK
jgi:tetratricopeptide (TPR) repeat protein